VTYTVSQADIDSGAITDEATASATTPGGGEVTSGPGSLTLPTLRTAGLTVVKSAPDFGPQDFVAGATIDFRYQVTSTGNVTVTGVSLVDSMFVGSGPVPTIECPATSLAPGTTIVCTARYTVSADDVANGLVSDQATATGSAPGGSVVSGVSNRLDVPGSPHPALALVKTVSSTVLTGAGQVLDYTYVISNTGDVVLSGVGVSEVLFTGAGAPPAPICPPGDLRPGADVVCTASYTTVPSDLVLGAVTNSARAVGVDPLGTRASSSVSTVRSTAETVAPGEPKPPSAEGAGSPLADTGGGMDGGFLASALALIGAGGFVLFLRRRRSHRL